MSQPWKLTAKTLTGAAIRVEISNPQTATVLDLKNAIHSQDGKLLPHLQRLVFQKGAQRTKLSDSSTLTEAGMSNGDTVLLVALQPCQIYIQGVDQRMHTVIVPASEPDDYKMASLRSLVEKQTGMQLEEYQFCLRGRPVDEMRHGRLLTLKECNIKANDTLVLTKIGLSISITNPQVDVCFLVDCTGSMSGHIEAVKNNVKSLRDALTTQYSGCDLRFAFVRYTDYDQPESTRTTWIDFTSNQSSFRGFVAAIRAEGGGDSPEDIMGGLNKTFWKLSWRSEAAKVLIHIADYPCHGTQYHDVSMDESYPNGDPGGISHDSMMQQVVRLEIQYWFGYINKQHTDQMIGVFNQCLQQISDQRFMIRQFDAVQPSEVGEAVHRSVTDSVSCSVAAKRAAVRKFTIDATVPNWSSTSIIEKYGKKTPPPGPKRLTDLQASLTLERPSVQICFKIAPNPFAEGTESLVHHAYDYTNNRRVVLKQYKRSAAEFNTLDSYMKKLEVHTIASTYGREFDADKQRPTSACSFSFAPLDVVHCPGGLCYLLEPFISGKIDKFNNNTGVVVTNQYSETFQAFSHYTWVKSGKTLLVCDLQGSHDGHKVLLTDPAINSKSEGGKYGHMDAGFAGIQRFFRSHTCSVICRQMGLEPHKL